MAFSSHYHKLLQQENKSPVQDFRDAFRRENFDHFSEILMATTSLTLNVAPILLIEIKLGARIAGMVRGFWETNKTASAFEIMA